MSFCSWIKYIFCCKSKPLLDLKNDQYNAMNDGDVTVTFNTGSPNGSNDTNRYSLSDEITYNDIYR